MLMEYDDESFMSAPRERLDSDDSNHSISTTASVTDVTDLQQGRSGSKNKLPSDFGFLTKVDKSFFEPPSKVARRASFDESSTSVDEASTSEMEEITTCKQQKSTTVVVNNISPQQPSTARVCGPEFIHTLRGTLLGREVALVCCGESHEDLIDLTRPGAILEPQRGWFQEALTPAIGGGFLGFENSEALKTKYSVSLQWAKAWAARVLEAEDEDDEDGAWMTWEGKAGTDIGVARVFSNDLVPSHKHLLPAQALLYKWGDSDREASDYNNRRLRGENVPTSELDAMVAERKHERMAEGLELFDDWLFRQCNSDNGKDAVQVDLILENQVSPTEVELHVEPGIGPAPPSHESLKCIELDSDADSDEEKDPDDGTGTFADYLLRRAHAHLKPNRVHCVDPRDLGNPEDVAENQLLRSLLSEPLPQDRDLAEMEAAGAQLAVKVESKDDKMSKGNNKNKNGKVNFRSGGIPGEAPNPLPCWESFFGTCAGLLYYSPHIKVDYVPFMAKCLGSPQKLAQFFDTLYFGTVPDALKQLGTLDEEARSLTRVRSVTYRPSPGADLMERPSDECVGMCPVTAAPVDRYLKYRGSYPPRTWVAGLGDQVRTGGLGEVVDAVQAWMPGSVMELLSHKADLSGDYFSAFLREAHRDIFDDIDTSDPEKMRKAKSMASMKHGKKKRHNLEDINIPNVEASFAEILKFDTQAGRASTKRQRVLAKILIDAYQLRLVDLSVILKMAHIATMAPEGKRLAIVLYAGSDHTKNVISFWEKHGFSRTGLPGKGSVGKGTWQDDEPRGLKMPPYLQNLPGLFPVPSAKTSPQTRQRPRRN